jgi:bifunctional UDP-N-acetylglucosamine pyrophosphorylase/glucosamine-1-phosphate N-acetyltransferase
MRYDAGQISAPLFVISPFKADQLQSCGHFAIIRRMQAVILAAGKGTRMGELTESIPKPMLLALGKPLLAWKIDAMPEEIDEVVLLIGYLGEKIREFFGTSYAGKKITYIETTELNGTAGGLFQMKDSLGERFLVMMGDDIYASADMSRMIKHEWALLAKRAIHGETADRILLDGEGRLSGFMKGTEYLATYGEGGLINTGMYMLNKKIFDFPLVKLQTKEEYGLPQTILGSIKEIDLAILETDFWVQISNKEDLETAAEILRKIP